VRLAERMSGPAGTIDAPGAPATGDPAGPLPRARGPLSEALRRALRQPDEDQPLPRWIVVEEPLIDDDLHLALYLCHELTYRGVVGVAEEREWDPRIVAFRRQLEAVFEAGLRDAVASGESASGDVASELRELAQEGTGPSLSRYLEREATAAQVREFVIQRSAYHLKEADPHSLALPRLSGPAKAALVEIQVDEYGGGDLSRMHATMFAGTMRALGLDPGYGAYLDRLPGATLALTNLVSMFGSQRRLLGALMGHLALFELTSSMPNRRYANGLRRLGYDEAATAFFDVHVVADAAHGAIASEDLAGSFVGDDAARAAGVLFGARALLHLEAGIAAEWTTSWRRGGTTLLQGRTT
jgi:hypothetical protein